MVAFGEQLKLLREKHDLSQLKLASMLGVSLSAISSLEQGKYEPTLETAMRVAVEFGRVELDHKGMKAVLVRRFRMKSARVYQRKKASGE